MPVVTVSRAAPVSVLVATTEAPGRISESWSSTVPVMVPVACANTGAAVSAKSAVASRKELRMCRMNASIYPFFNECNGPSVARIPIRLATVPPWGLGSQAKKEPVTAEAVQRCPTALDSSSAPARFSPAWGCARANPKCKHRRDWVAERVGFEPTVGGLPLHTLSKRAPSASRTSLPGADRQV